MAKVLIFLLLISGIFTSLSAKDTRLYWVIFQYKCGPAASVISPQIEQKRTASAVRSWQDMPVCTNILSALHVTGYYPKAVSRWLNAVVLELTPSQHQEIQNLPFVHAVQPVRHMIPAGLDVTLNDDLPDPAYFWGQSGGQTQMLNAQLLHLNRYTGKGVNIAVFDNGFPAVNTLKAFANTKVIGTYDFVADEADVYNNSGTHGTMVLSTLAAYLPEAMIGMAFDANYLLAVTENDMSETREEEYHWVRAAEWADSLGADIFTTSLGYTTFDDPTEDYTPADMDGNTTMITRASDAAASRGILVISSAGNQGNDDWRIVSAPADGDSVFAIGAVNADKVIASFSSRGPTSDLRIKPDMIAQGAGTAVVVTDGRVMRANGTSFSGPIIAGLAACLHQANPNLYGYEAGRILRSTGDRANNPNNDYGYGIPDARKAFELMTSQTLPEPTQLQVQIYPNPARAYFQLSLVFPGAPYPVEAELIDLTGRSIFRQNLQTLPFYNLFRFDANQALQDIAPGQYILRLHTQYGIQGLRVLYLGE
jgi:serine protease AprX